MIKGYLLCHKSGMFCAEHRIHVQHGQELRIPCSSLIQAIEKRQEYDTAKDDWKVSYNQKVKHFHFMSYVIDETLTIFYHQKLS